MTSAEKKNLYKLNLPKLKSYSQGQVSAKSGVLSLKTIAASEYSVLDNSMITAQDRISVLKQKYLNK